MRRLVSSHAGRVTAVLLRVAKLGGGTVTRQRIPFALYRHFDKHARVTPSLIRSIRRAPKTKVTQVGARSSP